MDATIPSRQKVMKDHKDAGGFTAAVFPIHYPRPLFRAYNVLPVEVWGPPKADPHLWEAHLQTYTCSVIRNGLSFFIAGGLDGVDMLVVPHCCDTLQGLGSILQNYLPQNKRVLTLYIPRDSREIDINYLAREMKILSGRIGEVTGTELDESKLIKCIDEEDRSNAIVGRMFQQRTQLSCSDREFYEIIRSREYLPADAFITLVEGFMARAKNQDGGRIPVVISGIIPEPMDIFNSLNGIGLTVVGDDLFTTGRRIYSRSDSTDPWTRMSEMIIKGPPDSTRGNFLTNRVKYLVDLTKESGARGVIFYHVKFCEPEQFYYPALKKGLENAGIPSVLVEAEIGDPLPGQVVTRLEAFKEVIS
ncbi:MAG: 2-hydroxyacyl-CoA dehydratase [Spirochaetes bacterium]|nr:2-hydroxyacyl-CoA dehydratase [Spirochaetota bacterium]